MKNYPLYKCLIYSEDNLFPETDVTNCIGDLEMLEVVLSRDKVSGVMPEVSFPMEFVLKARDLLKALFNRYGLYARARFKVEQREDFGIGYAVVKDAPLDFGTYKEYDNMVTIETTEAELLELINSEGKTKYEIPVNEVKEDKPWDYQRMSLVNSGAYRISGERMESAAKTFVNNFLLSITNTSSEIIPGSIESEFKGQGMKTNDHDYFFKALGDIPTDLYMKAKFEMNFSLILTKILGAQMSEKECQQTIPRVYIGFFRRDKSGEDRLEGKYVQFSNAMGLKTVGHGSWWEVKGKLDVEINAGGGVYSGESFKLMVRYDKSDANTIFMKDLKCTVENFKYFEVKYGAKSENAKKIDAIDPQKLIQTYLDRMAEEKNYYTAEIQWGAEENYKTKIVAAESIRQMPNAKLYGSPNDFFDWMQVLGYEFECVGRTLVFKPRDQFFRRDVTAMNLKARELADLIVQADQTHAYTSVEIGYDKHDYDSVNGRCEANGMFCYTTGFIARKDNKLKLISPYRADSMGIEFLCQETDKKTKDNKSDNDVFFVALTDNADRTKYVEYRGIEIIDEDLSLKMFNAPFNPYYLVKRNESLISINTKQLKFKSTDMSRTAHIVGVGSIYVDQQVGNKLFEPIEYNFAAGHWQKIPTEELRDGLIHFEWEGKVLKGFIKQIRKNYAAETETTWVLWMVS